MKNPAAEDKPYTDMSDAELNAELDDALEGADQGAGPPFRRVGDLGMRGDRTVPISLRVPSGLLERLKAEAARLGIGYQTLLLRLAETGLADGTRVPVRMRLTTEQLARLSESGSLDIHLEAS